MWWNWLLHPPLINSQYTEFCEDSLASGNQFSSSSPSPSSAIQSINFFEYVSFVLPIFLFSFSHFFHFVLLRFHDWDEWKQISTAYSEVLIPLDITPHCKPHSSSVDTQNENILKLFSLEIMVSENFFIFIIIMYNNSDNRFEWMNEWWMPMGWVCKEWCWCWLWRSVAERGGGLNARRKAGDRNEEIFVYSGVGNECKEYANK